jgi:hypothetical protein
MILVYLVIIDIILLLNKIKQDNPKVEISYFLFRHTIH